MAKFEANVRRDRLAIRALRRKGYLVVVIWECKTSNRARLEREMRKRLPRVVADGR